MSVVEVSKLVSSKALLLKHYYRHQGVLLSNSLESPGQICGMAFGEVHTNPHPWNVVGLRCKELCLALSPSLTIPVTLAPHDVPVLFGFSSTSLFIPFAVLSTSLSGIR